MTAAPQTTKCGLQSFTIKGMDISAYVNSLQIYENICKPYLTATATIIDNIDILNQLQIIGAEQVQFTVVADGGQTYTATMQLFAVKNERLNYSLRSAYYKMVLLGPEYFGDRNSLVQQSFQNQTGTQMISTVHNSHLGSTINIPMASTGLLGSGNPIVASSVSPMKFINDLRRQLTFGQYQSGSTLHYRDNTQCNLAPLEYLMTNIQNGTTFNQTATQGKNFMDMFSATNIIIDVTTNIDFQDNHGRLNMKDIAKTIQQEKYIIDIHSHKKPFYNTSQQVAPGTVLGTSIASLIQLATNGNHGGRHNYYMIDSQKFPIANVRQTDKEALYKAQMMSAPQIIMKVPIQGGFTVTVGKGFTANVQPPAGLQVSPSYQSMLAGQYLATSIEHECHFDDSGQSVTTIHGIKGGVTLS